MSEAPDPKDHEVFHSRWVTPHVPIDPAKDFYGRVQDVLDWLDVDKLGADDARKIYSNGGGTCPDPVPENDPILYDKRKDVLAYLVRDTGESLIDTASRSEATKDRFTDEFMHRQGYRFRHLRFALLFHDQRRSFRRFPAEIQLLIFEAAVEGTDFWDNTAYISVVAAISGTCWAFRNLIRSDKKFWCRFHTHPRTVTFFTSQIKVLSDLGHPNVPFLVDLALHFRRRETPLAASADRQKVERWKAAVQQIASGLALAPQTSNAPFARCTRLRLWGNETEWGILVPALNVLRGITVPNLRELEIEILDMTRPMTVGVRDRWPRFLGSTNLRILRMHSIVGLWDWPLTPPDASAFSNLVHLELHTLGGMGPRLRTYFSLFTNATQLQSFRLYSTTIRIDPDILDFTVTLPSLVELGLVAVDVSGVQALFRILRLPNLDRIELRDITYEQSRANFLSPGSSFLECSKLTDLRMHNISFDLPYTFDFRPLFVRFTNLLHFAMTDFPVGAVKNVHPLLLNESLTPSLKFFHWNFTSHAIEALYVKDGRGDAYFELYYALQEKRPSLAVYSAFDNEMMRFGRPFHDYTKLGQWDAE
ncbi:hypothetical protein EXIGLDRAFT_767715 [Exidia glandulosa HHB12029]|uniref:F-box domain-containing protein n=1 Tax=Exidia glandulosa HHB12029 TaxID=1314781 RepID=A0A165ITC5_EXIGL|nr:hypothetical protein EXIGLDRAFT_767715 [Exidia glandulosa HHB12029]